MGFHFLAVEMNKEQMIYDLIKEVRDNQSAMRDDIYDIKRTNLENHLNWVEHKRNTEALEKIVDLQGIRIEKLEEPEKVKEAVKNKAMKIMAFTTAVLSLLAAWAKYTGML